MARLAGCVAMVLVVGMTMSGCQAMQSVLDTASSSGLTQFVTLLEQAIDQNLVDLSSGGPYTIFAPTDDAFAKLSTQELNNVVNDPKALADVLKYHVVLGETFSWDLSNGRVLNTLNNHTLRIYNSGQNSYVNNGRVVALDIEAVNAVIHTIDEVLDVPEGTIYAVTRNSEYPLSRFADYVDKVNFRSTLDNPTGRKMTVFAPSNDAFARLNPVILDRIHSSSTYLRELIYYHIHAGTLHLKSLDRNATISTLDSGHTITVTVDTDLHLNRVAQMEQADIDCDNGVVHVIDHVLIPSSLGSVIG